MLRATMIRPGEIRFDEVPVPGIGNSEVLVRIRRIGVCGSDIHVYHGKHPYTPYPVVQGHEFSAEVVEVGADVTSLAVGDLVTAPPQITCGRCLLCRQGRYHICENLKVMGFQAPGVAQEFFVFPQAAPIKLPPGFTPEMGALVEPAAVAVHALRRAGDISGLNVLVLGAGPIGNLVAQAARWRGASRVAVTDLSAHRLDIARACGILHTVNVTTERLETALETCYGPDRADLILECVGSAETVNQAIRCARKGTAVVIVGVFADCPQVDLGLVQDRELQLLGSLMYRREDYVDAIRALDEGAIATGPLLSKRFPFRDYLHAYRFIDANREAVMKVIIEMNEPAN